MSGMQRSKGQTGEREVAAAIRDLTGWDVRRRVRQHEGDSDLDGIPGWTAECKRHARATRGVITGWWAQAAAQAQRAGGLPVLFFRLDRDAWRAVWPVAAGLVDQHAAMWTDYGWTVEGSLEAWCAVARDCAAAKPDGAGEEQR